MHNSTISVLFPFLSSYMFRHFRYPQGAYTKISLKPTEIHNLQLYARVLMPIVQFWLQIIVYVQKCKMLLMS
jgi:hypothetical protein